MVPVLAEPPVTPSTCQVTAVFAVPVTVAVKACDPYVGTATGAPLPVIATLTAEPAWIVTVAVADLVGSAKETAVTETVWGFGTIGGAMYTPPMEINPWLGPPPGVPFTSQRTVWFVVPVIAAENCRDAPFDRVAVFGVMVTVEVGGGGGFPPPLPEPPQDPAERIKARPAKTTKARRGGIPAEDNDFRGRNRPANMRIMSSPDP
jgi:hypothetical protein